MNCSYFKDQMLLYFGGKYLPEELRRHLAECSTCRATWEELTGVSGKLGADDLFFPDDVEVDWLVSAVDKDIEKREPRPGRVAKRIRQIWYGYVPVAAAAALALGIALGTYIGGRTTFDPSVAEPAGGVDSIASFYETEDEDLDEGTLGTLLYDFTAQHSFNASEWLLDDLTEEELEFLENNFDVGDLL